MQGQGLSAHAPACPGVTPVQAAGRLATAASPGNGPYLFYFSMEY